MGKRPSKPEPLNAETIAERNCRFSRSRANVIARNAVSGKGVRAVAKNPEAAAKNTITFDFEVESGERTDQKRSGRCWMFAALNTMRIRVMGKYKLKNFEFSQAFPLYFDKLEKSNWFLENILATLDEPLSGRMLSFLLLDPVCDGGQWDMFAALVKKYGAVPKETMPETACSINTHELCAYLTRYLRTCAKVLREAHESKEKMPALKARKREMLENVQDMLTICLGAPPSKFDVRLRDKDDKLALAGSFTPQGFFKEACGMNLDDFVSVISAPTSDKPYMRTYAVDKLGNVVEAGGVRYLNLPIERLKELAVAQLKDGYAVWFGCDVDQSYLQDDGIMDLASVDADSLFGFSVEGGFDRAARLEYGESAMTHAMTFEGVNLNRRGKPTLWKVENSWGKDHGREGFDTLSDPWFSEYVYQVVVNKAYLSAEEREIYETCTPVLLEPWDPFGALA